MKVTIEEVHACYKEIVESGETEMPLEVKLAKKDGWNAVRNAWLLRLRDLGLSNSQIAHEFNLPTGSLSRQLSRVGAVPREGATKRAGKIKLATLAEKEKLLGGTFNFDDLDNNSPLTLHDERGLGGHRKHEKVKHCLFPDDNGGTCGGDTVPLSSYCGIHKGMTSTPHKRGKSKEFEHRT